MVGKGRREEKKKGGVHFSEVPRRPRYEFFFMYKYAAPAVSAALSASASAVMGDSFVWREGAGRSWSVERSIRK